ncbi:MAG TPA: IclR family transcriptional regulator [Ferrovibrio sp.]|uniref:IclR family transcriptional regulator n=1 Tax=Ferrovibrio sp. TaxID=1917215 RepID=UPI002ED06C44
MDVKTAGRVFDLFEVFAALKRPATLSELSREMEIPVSSCFNLLRTIENRGYLYSVKPRGSLYPTKRILEVARVIAANDPIAARISPLLQALRDASEETIVFAKRRGLHVVYLDVLESPHRIRYSAQIGEIREMYSNSIGKAIMSHLPLDERHALYGQMSMTKHTPATLTTKRELDADIEKSIRRGWFSNVGETVSDVMSIAVPVNVGGDICGISLVGPIHRMKPKLQQHIELIQKAAKAVEAAVGEAH